MTHYEVLGVEPTATEAQVRAAYLAKARELHPDRHAGASPAELERVARAMQEVNAAWAVLSDPRARRQYDATLRARGIGAPAGSRGAHDRQARAGGERVGPPPVVLTDDGHGTPLPTLVRIGPVALLLAVLATIFVVTAFAGGDRSDDAPAPVGRRAPDVGSCVDVSGSTVAETPCDSPNALRVDRLAVAGDRCGRIGEVPIVWDDDTVLCVRPPS
ncbi:MAG TPA: J domain-containing protein [Acidimicrobiales bacterium]